MDAIEFENFVAKRKKDLQRIARHTRGEYQFDDVVSEAWIKIDEFAKEGLAVDLRDADFQTRVIKHLYQDLVRYTETTVRYALHLDHSPDETEPAEVHPLLRTLASDGGRDPLAYLVEAEIATADEDALRNNHSLAAAYVHLLRHFDHRMPAVADHLLISVSHAYRRCAQARRLAAQQNTLQTLLARQFIPGPWRRFRIRRTPIQLAFDFEEQLFLLPSNT